MFVIIFLSYTTVPNQLCVYISLFDQNYQKSGLFNDAKKAVSVYLDWFSRKVSTFVQSFRQFEDYEGEIYFRSLFS